MKNKYNLTKEENIFIAKRNIIEYIWKDANLEGIAITFPDTEMIFNGLSVEGYKVNDIVSVNNLKYGWQFILNNLDYPLDFKYICAINKMIGSDNLILRAGYLRQSEVRITGTDWKPGIKTEEQVKKELLEIELLENPTDRALTLMFYLMRNQLFLDGNKRTGMLAANKIMIENGVGIIAIPIEKQKDFRNLLVKYYETGDMQKIKQFTFDFGIDGIDLSKEKFILNK